MKLHTAAILLLFWLGIFTVHTVKGSAGTQRMNKYRCVNLSTNRLNIQNLVSYERQQVPTDAIMFITARGIRICVSANQKWVQTAINHIDQRRAKRK
ncbi:lymphotactin-like [Catharus ustulatus]|uniref:Chemokine interleukin-8-like domain-containing protein n=1 Tax=Catharus ustulatus TaxID=91951 RepID=A0A8C3TUV9_CATUS|nr:lymphotactin-like [Catharus ustulatus]